MLSAINPSARGGKITKTSKVPNLRWTITAKHIAKRDVFEWHR